MAKWKLLLLLLGLRAKREMLLGLLGKWELLTIRVTWELLRRRRHSLHTKRIRGIRTLLRLATVQVTRALWIGLLLLLLL